MGWSDPGISFGSAHLQRIFHVQRRTQVREETREKYAHLACANKVPSYTHQDVSSGVNELFGYVVDSLSPFADASVR